MEEKHEILDSKRMTPKGDLKKPMTWYFWWLRVLEAL